MKKKITFNIWNFLDIDDVSDILDDTLKDEKIFQIPINISYEIINIDKTGNISIQANFDLF